MMPGHNQETIADRMAGGPTTGFDYLRISLSLAVLVVHSTWVSTGDAGVNTAVWTSDWRFVVASVLPVFFALSGFLVAGSLTRTRLHQFAALRILRLVPALAVEITLCAIGIGLACTTLPWSDYVADPRFAAYFLNIVGDIHYALPGVFEHNIAGSTINEQLWTIPFELECYVALILLAATGIVRRRLLLVSIVALLTVALLWGQAHGFPIRADEHVPGRMLVMSFLAAVGIYLYGDKLPYSHVVGALSGIVGAYCLQHPGMTYLAAFPVAYFTVWVGLMRPPHLPFGDLSYGVYLFHYPVEQSIMHLTPGQPWWRLSMMALPPTVLCALLSWVLVERPVLRRKKKALAVLDSAIAWTANRIAVLRMP